MAAKRLEEQLPEEDVFKSRMCCIYKDELSPDAVLWLANLHNRIGEYRHTMVLKDKVTYTMLIGPAVGRVFFRKKGK